MNETLRPVAPKTPGWRQANQYQRALLDVLRAPYVGGTAPAITRTSACALLGHPEKHPEIALADKQDQEKGCCCGMRSWI